MSSELCLHGNNPENCKDCLIQGFRDTKQAKKRVPIKTLKNRSRDQERQIAEGYKKAGFPHAKRQAMSGALAILPGDVDPGSLLLVEAKLTRSGRLVIDPAWLAQVRRQSEDMGRAGYYTLHAWVAKDNEQYHKVVVVDEDLWYAVLGWFREQEDA